MCHQCNGTGRIYTTVMHGVFQIAPCQCEHANFNFEQKMKEIEKRIREAEERFKTGVSG
jgi:predicted  nucleic acid-binding Zn-ribbon protein